jgi:hypothetical protein
MNFGFVPRSPLSNLLQERGLGWTASRLMLGYASFRFTEMMEEPFTTVSDQDYPPHMQSMWSFIYGCFHSIVFNFWPGAYYVDERSNAAMALSRASLLFGLVPLGLLCLGFVRATARLLAGLKLMGVRYLGQDQLWTQLALVVCGIIFIVKFDIALHWPNRDLLKPIYFMPALFSLTCLFVEGYTAFERSFGRARNSMAALHASFAILIMLYLVDLTRLFTILHDMYF